LHFPCQDPRATGTAPAKGNLRKIRKIPGQQDGKESDTQKHLFQISCLEEKKEN